MKNYLTLLFILFLSGFIFNSCTPDSKSKSVSEKLELTEQKVENLSDAQNKELSSSVVIKSKTCIDPPSNKLDLEFSSFNVNSNNTSTITLTNGGEIIISEDTFEKLDGSSVSGSVEILYREFLTAAEILVSGIPMVYNNGSESIDFQSAGMFEIRAYQGTDELRIKQGKKISMKTATSSSDSNYDFFFLDEEENNWEVIANSTAITNTTKKKELDRIEEELSQLKEPLKPVPSNEDEYVFDLKYNFGEFPELHELAGVLWHYAGDDETINPKLNPTVLQPVWNEVAIIPTDTEYVFELKLANTRDTLIMLARPVMNGKILREANALFDSKLASYKEEFEMRVAQKRQLKQQADLFRIMDIGEFGVYNYDRQYKIPNAVAVLADFSFGEKYAKDAPFQNVYLVPGNGGVVVKYTPDTRKNFRFDSLDNNRLVAILSDNKIAVFTDKQFRDLNLKNASNAPVPFTFQLTLMENAPENLEDFDELMAGI